MQVLELRDYYVILGMLVIVVSFLAVIVSSWIELKARKTGCTTCLPGCMAKCSQTAQSPAYSKQPSKNA